MLTVEKPAVNLMVDRKIYFILLDFSNVKVFYQFRRKY